MSRAFRLPEDAARRVWLARAVEAGDADGSRVRADERLLATDMARGGSGGAEFLGRRAGHLLGLVSRHEQGVVRAERWARWPAALDWGAPAVAFVLGLGAQALDGREISIIFFPLLGMLAWNLLVYLLIAAGWLVALGRGQADDRPWLGRLVGWMVRRLPGDAALRDFARDWTAAVAELWARRARRVLHLCAAALALGAVSSMFLNPFGVDYRVGWESERFAGRPEALEPVVRAVYGPASRVTGIPLPDAEGLRAMSWARGGNDDAWPWIQLFLATALMGIVGPRLLLAGWEGLRARRLAGRVPVPGHDDAWAARLLGHAGASALSVRVLPVFYAPPPGAAELLRGAATGAAGPRATLEMEAQAKFGAEEVLPGELPSADRWLLLFNLAATPEAETHGALVRALRARLGRGAGISALVDEAAYAARLGPGADAARRLEERRRTWRAVLTAAGVDAGFADLSAARADDPALARAVLGAAG